MANFDYPSEERMILEYIAGPPNTTVFYTRRAALLAKQDALQLSRTNVRTCNGGRLSYLRSDPRTLDATRSLPEFFWGC